MIKKRIKALVLVVVLAMAICSCGKNNDEGVVDSISDEQAVLAIRNYCCTANPDLESTAAEGYPVYWDIDSSDENEVVVLFRSYTGAMIRYYIDRATGNTNVTEFVPGIMDEEEPTDENFNVRDYIQ